MKKILLSLMLSLTITSPVYADFNSPYQGTVQTVNGTDVAPLLTCTVTGNPRVNPTLTWTLNSVTANKAFGNFTNSTGQPSYGVVSIPAGGHGATSALGGFNNLSPLTTVGDMLSFFNGNNVRIAGNTSSTKMYLTSTGTGVAANIPVWGTIGSADIPWGSPGTIGSVSPGSATFTTLSLNTPLGISSGGTNNGSLSVANGGILYTDGSKINNLGTGTQYQVVQTNGSGIAPSYTNTWNGVGSIITGGTTTLTGPCATLQEISNLSGSVNVLAPVASTCPGQLLRFLHTTGTNGSNTITVTAQGSDTFSGQATVSIDPVNLNSGLLIESDGTTWKVLESFPLAINNGGTNNANLAVTANGVVVTDGSKLVNSGAVGSNQLLGNSGSGVGPVTLSYGSNLLGTANYNQTTARASGASPLTLTGADTTTQLITTGSGTFTNNLPACSAVPHKVYLIKKVDSGVGTIAVTPNGSDKIDGASNYTVASQYDFIAVQSDGVSNWEVVGKFQAAAGTGTVTNFSASGLTNVFTTSVSTSTTTPSLTFSFASTCPAHSYLGNNTGSTGSIGLVQPGFGDLTGSATSSQISTAFRNLCVTGGQSLGSTWTLTGTFIPGSSSSVLGGTNGLGFNGYYVSDGTGSSYSNFITVNGTLGANQTCYIPSTGTGYVPLSKSPVAHNFLTGLNTSNQLTAAQPDFSDLTGNQALSQMPTGMTYPQQVRIYNSSGNPFQIDQNSSSNFYVGPVNGNCVSLPDSSGNNFTVMNFSEISTGIISGLYRVYDIFLYNNSGTVSVEADPWDSSQVSGSITGVTVGATTSFTTGSTPPSVSDVIGIAGISGTVGTDTAAGLNGKTFTVASVVGSTVTLTESSNTTGLTFSGSGTWYKIPKTRATGLTYQNGFYLRTGSLSRLYIGTIMMGGKGVSGWTYDDSGSRLIWNYFNRIKKNLIMQDFTTSWTWSTQNFKNRNNSSALGTGRSQAIYGLVDAPIPTVSNTATAANSVATKTQYSTMFVNGIFNNVSTFTTPINVNTAANPMTVCKTGSLYGYVNNSFYLGYQVYQMVDFGASSGTTTFYGNQAFGGNYGGVTEITGEW